MNPEHSKQPQEDLLPPLSSLRLNPIASPPRLSPTPISSAQRRIAIPVDLSDESAFSVHWAINNYLRPGDAVILLHVRPTSVLYGADWGSIKVHVNDTDSVDETARQKLEDDFDTFTTNKANSIAQPLVDAQIPFKIHIVKDHDMKERLCLEVERLGLSAVIMGSRGFGAARRNSKGKLGSVSDYCVHHCICPVVVVRLPGYEDGEDAGKDSSKGLLGDDIQLHPVPEEDQEYHDASDEQKGDGQKAQEV